MNSMELNVFLCVRHGKTQRTKMETPAAAATMIPSMFVKSAAGYTSPVRFYYLDTVL